VDTEYSGSWPTSDEEPHPCKATAGRVAGATIVLVDATENGRRLVSYVLL
jgi:hypothetical protein